MAFMKTKILVVDDEPDVVELVDFNLKAAGFDVVTATDGGKNFEVPLVEAFIERVDPTAGVVTLVSLDAIDRE